MKNRTLKLGTLCKIEKGTTGIQKAIPGEYPLVVTGEARKSHNDYQFDCEAVIVPLVSSTGHGHRSLNRIHYQTGKFALGSILCAIIPIDSQKLNAEFLFHFLNFNKERELVSRMKGMANVTLPMKEIADIDIPDISIKDQLEFVKFFELIEFENKAVGKEFTHQLSLVRQLRQAFLREAMQGKLVPQNPADEPASELLRKIKAEKEQLIKDKKLKKEKPLPPIKPEEIPFEIPENWVWCRLDTACLNIIDCPHSTPKYLDIDTGFYGIDTNCLDESGKIKRLRNLSEEGYFERIRRLEPTEKDIIYAREGSIGLSAFIPAGKKICLGQRVMLFRSSIGIYPEFLKMVVTDENYKSRILKKHRGMGAKHVNVKDIVESLIPLPPLSEQLRIVQKLEQLMQLCDGLEQSISQSQQQNEMLLQQVLREALEPKEVNAG